MKLGAFSISLTVKDLTASKAFYEKLGFETTGKVADGVAFESEADEATTGPASFVIHDPDGNPILVDQHV